MNYQSVPFSTLKLDPKTNVRIVGRAIVDPAFVASIRAHGVKLPLSVRPNGGKHYLVVDGGKRFAALQALHDAGEILADHPIPVRIEEGDEASARETSLTLNVVRSALHPVDEYRAFAALSLDVDAIAQRFGVERKIVEQRLALGSLDDSILDAWVADEIREDAAMAFTLVPNKQSQAKLFAKLKKLGRVYAGAIKSEIKAGADNCGPLLKLVGFEAYEQAGGKITRDLFGDDHVVSDLALLRDMASVKFNEKVEELLAEGWGWAVDAQSVENRYQYGHLDAKFEPKPEEKKRLVALEKRMRDDDLSFEESDAARDQLEALRQSILLRGVTPAQKASAGCFVSLDPHRGLVIEYGRTKPEASREKTKTKRAKDKDAKAASITKAVQERLAVQRQTVVRNALVRHPHKDPLAKLLAQVVSDTIQPGRWNYAPQPVQDKFDAIVKTIAPKILQGELVGMFNIADYAKGASKSLLLAVIKEACGGDVKKLATKSKGELVKFVVANARKGWLPKELRVK